LKNQKNKDFPVLGVEAKEQNDSCIGARDWES